MSIALMNKTKTTRPSKTGYQRPWYILDAANEPLGRLATKAANFLMGKNLACYASDVDMGVMVVVINADKIVLTGQKAIKKNYFRHSGRIGSLKITSFPEQMAKDSTVPIYKAVNGMLPKNRHQDLRINNRLFIFKGDHNFTNHEQMTVSN